MSKWIVNEFVPGISATVSCHGYFHINRGPTAAYYGAGAYESPQGVIGPDGKRLPVPEYLHSGSVSELGIRYSGEIDDLDVDTLEEVTAKLVAWWEAQSTEVHDRYCTTCESTHDGTETPRGLAWTCDGCGERQEYRA